MKRQIIGKGRRIYSLEPNKLFQATFARKYVNQFMTALTKIIGEKRISSSDDHEENIVDHCICEVYKKVRYEVDMALVISTQGLMFAWSHALEHNLQVKLSVAAAGSFKCSSSHCGLQQAILSTKISPDISIKNPKVYKKKLRRPMRVIMPPKWKKSEEEEEAKESKDEKLIDSRLMNLRSVLPGGGENMGDDRLLSEVASYVVCLQLQVNVLKCLIDMN